MIILDFIFIFNIKYMGASNSTAQASNQSLPHLGKRILAIMKPELQQKLNIYSDYILSIPPTIKIQDENIEILVFSILDYSKRKEILNINDYRTGIQLKNVKINDCMLKITKVFSGSPFQKQAINPEEYIIGLQNQQFDDLKTFAQNLKKLIEKRSEIINLIICSKQGKTRRVSLSLKLLDQWKLHNKGILGCELAEGWINRFKSNPTNKQKNYKITLQNIQGLSKKGQPQIKEERSSEKHLKDQLAQTLNSLKRQNDNDSEQSEEIQKRLNLFDNSSRIIQKNFKGILKGQQIQDASEICKCKIYDKHCQNCFIIKENAYYFFNKKTNRIINIPSQLLFLTE